MNHSPSHRKKKDHHYHRRYEIIYMSKYLESDFLQFLHLTCGYSTTVILDLKAFLQFVQLSPYHRRIWLPVAVTFNNVY
jgi:hypothetical protein